MAFCVIGNDAMKLLITDLYILAFCLFQQTQIMTEFKASPTPQQ